MQGVRIEQMKEKTRFTLLLVLLVLLFITITLTGCERIKSSCELGCERAGYIYVNQIVREHIFSEDTIICNCNDNGNIINIWSKD